MTVTLFACSSCFMKQKGKHRPLWHRLFCLLMAFYVINVSIDAPDGYVLPNATGELREDLSVNEIESLGELLFEHGFGWKDAVPEHDEADEAEDKLTKIVFDWSIPGPILAIKFDPAVRFVTTTRRPYTGLIYGAGPIDITIPPPKSAKA
ncbi:hypothetical protein LC612_43650 [Nostoc sp. CHAB 5834]|nr:hypothetical protein [Nostoc sp. CHAB 5834]